MTDITWMQVLALMIGSGGITSGAVAITMERIRRVLESIQGPRLEWGHGCENGKGSCTANKKFT